MDTQRQGPHVSRPRSVPRHSSTVLSLGTSSVLSVFCPETEHEAAHTCPDLVQSSGQGTVDQGGPGAGESTVTGTGPPDLLSPQTPPPLQWLGRPLCLHGERGACPMRSRFYLPCYSSPSQVIKQLKILTEQPDHR